MNLLCKWFGHRPEPGWRGSPPYMKVIGGGIDGILRAHASIWHECERCGETYMIGYIHLTVPVIEEALRTVRMRRVMKGLTEDGD